MRIAVSAANNIGLESTVAQHFGRCPFYILIDMEGTEIKTIRGIDNPHYESHQPGMVPAFINDQDVNVMVAGGMGGRAIQFFEEFGIEVATGASGLVKDALTAFQAGELTGSAACKESEEHGH